MSYTLRGRLESRLAGALLPFLAACALALAVGAWWPVQLAGLMVGAGALLDVVYHPLLPYQPGWVAFPLGALELGATMALALSLGVEARLWPALAFFAGSWLAAQVVAQAVLPLVHLSYGDDGGELGRGGPALQVVAPCAVLAVAGVAWATQPPTVRLAAGVHEGPLVLDRAQRLVGERGAVVRGGIVVTADDVVVRGVEVRGGRNGISVDGADDVLIEDVTVSGAAEDGINVRRSTVTIRNCTVRSSGAYSHGIDLSYSFDLAPSLVERCTVTGGFEGIVTHFVKATVRRNLVTGTSLRGITMTEMSMGSVERNIVRGVRGVGVFCGDYSHCHVAGNDVSFVRPDPTSSDRSRAGVAILAHYGAKIVLGPNRIVRSPGGVNSYSGATFARE